MLNVLSLPANTDFWHFFPELKTTESQGAPLFFSFVSFDQFLMRAHFKLVWAFPTLTVCFYHVTYAFQSESTLYSCLNVKELLAQCRRKICILSEWNWTRTHNHLVHKRTVIFRLWTKSLWVRVQLQSFPNHIC